MSGESTDSESFPINNNKRSRSLLRQVRATLGGRSSSRRRLESSEESPSVVLLRQKRRSFDNYDTNKYQSKSRTKKDSITKSPSSFSHRLSLLTHMKTHFIGPRKYRRAVPSTWNNDDDIDDDDYQSIPPLDLNSVS